MLNKSDYLRNANINHNLRGVSYTSPSARYIVLYTTAPTSAGGGVEVIGAGYERKAVTFSAPSTPGSVSNSAPINYTPTGDWGNIVAVGVQDALSGGNLLYFGPLGTPRLIYAGDNFMFPAGYFVVSET